MRLIYGASSSKNPRDRRTPLSAGQESRRHRPPHTRRCLVHQISCRRAKSRGKSAHNPCQCNFIPNRHLQILGSRPADGACLSLARWFSSHIGHLCIGAIWPPGVQAVPSSGAQALSPFRMWDHLFMATKHVRYRLIIINQSVQVVLKSLMRVS